MNVFNIPCIFDNWKKSPISVWEFFAQKTRWQDHGIQWIFFPESYCIEIYNLLQGIRINRFKYTNFFFVHLFVTKLYKNIAIEPMN